MSQNNVAIGIDLGTTYSCVGVYRNGKVEILSNDQGNRTTPSYVSFNETERTIGEGAKNLAAMNPTNTVFDAKRLIGRSFNDQVVQDDVKLWPFTVVAGPNDKPQVEVTFKGEQKLFYAEELSAMVLTKMKETAEAALGHPVTKAVITVPAYFNDAQRSATRDAGFIAGLEVLRIITEPTAAALAYGFDATKKKDEKVLVFDCGGGTHDVSILEISEDGLFEVLATDGDTHLGGEDIDNKLVEYCLTEFIKKNPTLTGIRENDRSIRRLRTACERAKRTLSSSNTTVIEVDSLFEGTDISVSLTRAKFDSMCENFYDRCMAPVENVLRDAKLGKGDIDEVVLVGGSTRIPKLQERLSTFFNGKKLNNSINQDEAVAYGAAIYASILAGNKDAKTEGFLMCDVTPLSVGILTGGSVMTKIIPRNTTIPCKKSETFTNGADNQEIARIVVLQGEREQASKNTVLGTFDLKLKPARRGELQIEVTYDIDANGILVVSATETLSGTTEKVNINCNDGRMTKEEIEAKVNEANQYADEDKAFRELTESKNKLEGLIYSTKNSLDDEAVKSKLSESDRQDVTGKLNECQQWLQGNENATKQEVDDRFTELQTAVQALLARTQGSADNEQQAESEPEEVRSGPKVEEVD
jgi:L1 cell adhesion molecule like protein